MAGIASPSAATPGAAGLNISTIEDMVRYALLYTPGWDKVAKEKVISDTILKFIQDFGNPEAYVGSGEEAMGKRWFGETPYTNTAQWDHSAGLTSSS